MRVDIAWKISFLMVLQNFLNMKKILYLSILISLFSCNDNRDQFYMPAEWEPQDAVWFGWEKTETFFYPVVAEMISTLVPHVKVNIAVSSDSLMKIAKLFLTARGLDTSKVGFYLMPGDRYWIRDHGASFLVNGKGELGAVQFRWNLYGHPQYLKEIYGDNKDSIALYTARDIDTNTGNVSSMMAAVTGAKLFKCNVFHEGGGMEVNGRGTLILCEATEIQRNPGRTKDELEGEYRKVLGVTKIIWMKQGLADDPEWILRRICGNYIGVGIGGHTDEFVRFSGPGTILLAWVDEKEKDLNPLNRMNYKRLSENLEILQKSTDQDGRPFTIIKVPLPDIIPLKVVARKILTQPLTMPPTELPISAFVPSEAPKDGDTLLWLPAATYLNYLVTNELVLLPTYTSAGTSGEKEEAVRKIFSEQFAGRDIRFFNMMYQNYSGGGIHCSTQQQPSRSKH
jgi:agmatine deiminase